MCRVFSVYITFFILLSGCQILAQCNEVLPENWYCDERLKLNLRAGTVKEIVPYKKDAKNEPIADFIFNEIEHQTVNVIKFKVLDFVTGKEMSEEFDYFNVRTSDIAAKEFKVGEKYVFEANWFGVNSRGKGSFENKLKFIRPNGFVKLYSDSKEEIELFKKTENFAPFKEFLGVEAGEAVSGGVVSGKATSLPKPLFPRDIPALKRAETVKVLVLIGEDGTVLKARAICAAHKSLADAAEQAARATRFSPTFLSGKAAKVKGFIVYNFVP